MNKIQNKKNILFCGSYFGYGFHEDGIKSSIDMLKTLMIKNSYIYDGNVIHKRFKPKVHFFKYKVFSLLIDLSELELLDKRFKNIFI